MDEVSAILTTIIVFFCMAAFWIWTGKIEDRISKLEAALDRIKDQSHE